MKVQVVFVSKSRTLPSVTTSSLVLLLNLNGTSVVTTVKDNSLPSGSEATTFPIVLPLGQSVPSVFFSGIVKVWLAMTGSVFSSSILTVIVNLSEVREPAIFGASVEASSVTVA